MALNWRGTWNTQATYQVDDVVFYLTASYVALDISTNITPTQANVGTYWATFAVGLTGLQGNQGVQGIQGIQGVQGIQGIQGLNGSAGQGFTWRNSYMSTVTYNQYDCVSYNGSSYICISSNVLNISPDSDPSKWNVLAVAGTNGSTSAVTSVFSRSGAVVAEADDYSEFYLPISGGSLTGTFSTPPGSGHLLNGGTDSNWGIGLSNETSPLGWFSSTHVGPNSVASIVHGTGPNDGFAVGSTDGTSDLEIDNTGKVWVMKDFDVSGNANFQNAIHIDSQLLDSTASSGIAGQVLTNSGGNAVIWANPSGGTVVSGITYNGSNGLTATSTAWQVVNQDTYIFYLPNATTLEVGQTYNISNTSGASAITVGDSTGNPITAITTGSIVTFVLMNNSTAVGAWFHFVSGTFAAIYGTP